jgi:biopolymer transport protein ExbB/TolQ
MTAQVCRWSVLSLASASILFTWTVILPWIGDWHAVRGRIDFLDERGIDPAALYYTDLDVMAEIEANIAALENAHPEAFWRLQKSRREFDRTPSPDRKRK